MFDEVRSAKVRPKNSAIWVKPSVYTIVVPLKNQKSLAYHTLSQTLALWDAADTATWELLCREARVAFSSRYRDFARGGFIVNADVEEIALAQRAFEKARNDSRRLMMTVAPTLSCNFRCEYCFQGLDKPLNKMSSRTQAAVEQFIVEKLEGRQSLHLTWYGGEPLMHAQAIWSMSDRISEACRALEVHYSASMISNGYLMTPAIARSMRVAQISKVQITLDGAAETHDRRRHLASNRPTYARILENIEIVARERLFKVSVRVNIDGENERHSMDLLDDLAGRGLGLHNGVSVYFAPVESVAEAADGCTSCLSKTGYAAAECRLQAAAFERGLMGVPKPPKFMGLCTALRPDSFVVTPNGDLHKCWDTVMDARRRVGSVFRNDRSSDDEQAQVWNSFSPFDNAICRVCKILPSCASACAFKFVHNDYASGEAGRLPCPSLKFNFCEQIFARAKARGFVSDHDWDPNRSPTVQPEGPRTGNQHTLATMTSIHSGLQDGRKKSRSTREPHQP